MAGEVKIALLFFVSFQLIAVYALFLIFWKTFNSAFCNSSKYETLPGSVEAREVD